MTRLYTQNIDGLDYQTNICPQNVVGVHGTMGRIVCEFCKSEYPIADFCREVKSKIKDIYKTDPDAPEQSSEIPCLKCGKPGVKPATVLYSSPLPRDFFNKVDLDFPGEVDVLFVVGTSLTVSPANMLVNAVSDECFRVIVNREPVGEDLGIEYKNPTRDVFLQGTCDEAILSLVAKLGWMDDLKLLCPHLLEEK